MPSVGPFGPFGPFGPCYAHLNGKAGLEQVSWLSPSRWGFGAAASTTNLNHVTPPPSGSTADPLWQHSAHLWLLDMAMQFVLAAR